MAIVAGVRFKDAGKVYYFDPGELVLEKGDYAIVETARGVECGYVSMGNRDVPDSDIVSPLKIVIRKATEADLAHVAENEQRQKEAFSVCEAKILEHELDMKLVDVEFTFDNSKILFYFTSDGRVDFRNLVKDLAAIFRTRIELRQIGVRDEAKMLGGLGICGRPFCCAQFLGDFQPVSIKMAKEQGLSLNPVKISGTCGRLMCCLKYEQNAYEDLIRTTPRVGTVLNTPDGRGIVTEQNLIAGTLKIRPENNPEATPKTYSLAELNECNNAALLTAKREAVNKAREERIRDEEAPREERTEKIKREPAEPVAKPEGDRPKNERPKNDRPRNHNNHNNAAVDNGDAVSSETPKAERVRGDRPRNDRPRNHGNHGTRNNGNAATPETVTDGERSRNDRPRSDRPRNHSNHNGHGNHNNHGGNRNNGNNGEKPKNPPRPERTPRPERREIPQINGGEK